MTHTAQVKTQTLRLISDPRIGILVKKVTSQISDEFNTIDLILTENGDFFMKGVLDLDKAVKSAKRYFDGKEDYMNDTLSSLGFTEESYKYVKRFPDGCVHILCLGSEWSSVPGYAHGMYGHIISERVK